MFSLVRCLRNRGIDAHLLLLNEPDHFRPEADSFNNDIKKYTHQLNWFSSVIENNIWTTVTKAQLRKDLKEYDVLIGCGYSPAFLEYADLKLDLFIPYGSDFYELPFIKYWKQKINSINNLYPLLQKRGIEKASHVLFDFTKEQEPIFKKFELKGKRHFTFPPILYSREFNTISIQSFLTESNLFPHIQRIRNENDLLIFQHSRQSWKNPEDEFSNKRNDILIYAFAEFLKRTNLNSKLILLEYGIDVSETRKLISDLNIAEHIVWLPKSPRKELLIAMSLCDIGVGELGMSFLMYGAVGEFMAMELPFIHNCCVADYTGRYPELYENNHADSMDSLLTHFEQFSLNRQAYYLRARRTKIWFDKYMIEIPIAKITELINQCYNKPWYKNIFN